MLVSVYVFKQSRLRIRREMNVERGRERNTDSKGGLRNVVCRFRLFARRWKRSQYCKICAAVSFDKDLFHMLSALGKSKSRITIPLTHFVSRH